MRGHLINAAVLAALLMSTSTSCTMESRMRRRGAFAVCDAVPMTDPWLTHRAEQNRNRRFLDVVARRSSGTIITRPVEHAEVEARLGRVPRGYGERSIILEAALTLDSSSPYGQRGPGARAHEVVRASSMRTATGSATARLSAAATAPAAGAERTAADAAVRDGTMARSPVETRASKRADAAAADGVTARPLAETRASKRAAAAAVVGVTALVLVALILWTTMETANATTEENAADGAVDTVGDRVGHGRRRLVRLHRGERSL